MDPQSFRSSYGPWALVAGASEGLGAAFARRLGELGLNLVLLARRGDLLEETARGIRAAAGVEVRTAAIDLAAPDLMERLLPGHGELDFGLLVYNAAYGSIKPFLRTSTAELLTHLEVNCRAPLLLSRHFAERFRQRGRGGILLMSSVMAFQGTSLLATYAATKSFDLVLGESLHHELASQGTDVLVCVAGATRTPNYLGTAPRYGRIRPSEDEPERVVEEALGQLGRRSVHVVGRFNRLLLTAFQLMGRRLASSFMNRNLRSVYSHRLDG